MQKAFDQIDHYILLNKLNAVGLSDNLLSLISSYLIGRELFVEYGGYRSKIYIATSGVPQGSNLGPLLFLLFFNDLSLKLGCPHLMFADDLKLYFKINSISDCLQLQRNLNIVTEWCTLNRLQLNVSKCKIMSFTKRRKHCLITKSMNLFLIGVKLLKIWVLHFQPIF